MLGVLRRLRRGRARVDDPEGLADFMARATAFVSQRVTLDYCRARAGISWPQLFRESEFGQALEHCRWEAYAAILGDVGEVALIYLRQCGCEGEPVAAGVAKGLRSALERYPVPTYRAGWQDALDAHAARLHRALLAPPRPVREVGRSSARRVFEVLPVHTDLKMHDREMVTNNLRFLLCGVYADMERRLDGPVLGRAFNVDAHPKPPPERR